MCVFCGVWVSSSRGQIKGRLSSRLRTSKRRRKKVYVADRRLTRDGDDRTAVQSVQGVIDQQGQ